MGYLDTRDVPYLDRVLSCIKADNGRFNHLDQGHDEHIRLFGIQDRDHHPQDIIVNSGYRAIMAKEGEVPSFRAYRRFMELCDQIQLMYLKFNRIRKTHKKENIAYTIC